MRQTAMTKERREVERLSARLPKETMAQLKWMSFRMHEDTLKRFNEQERKRKIEDYEYYCIITTFKGWQVVRHYLVSAEYGKRNPFRITLLQEVSQRWMKIDEDGKIHLHICELKKSMFWYYKCHPYALDSPLSLKPWSTNYNRGGRTRFNYNDCDIYPQRRFTKEVTLLGLDRQLGRTDEIDLYVYYNNGKLYNYPLALQGVKKGYTKQNYLPIEHETLYKIGLTEYAECYLRGASWMREKVQRFYKSLIIANRHHFAFPQMERYIDYLSNLAYLGLDMRNPHYICPTEFDWSAMQISEKAAKKYRREAEVRRQREEERVRRLNIELMERQEKELAIERASYAERMAEYLNIVISNSNLIIKPLQSIEEFQEEGTAMHHCVYQMGYYKEGKNCLILSAKDKDGKRVETIEVGLDTFKVRQSRGVCNSTTPYHNEILALMNKNMGKIRKIAKSKRVVA